MWSLFANGVSNVCFSGPSISYEKTRLVTRSNQADVVGQFLPFCQEINKAGHVFSNIFKDE
jgi:hypothetical protein